MPCPENSLHVILGEVNMVLTAMKHSFYRWSSHQQESKQDKFLKSFTSLRIKLSNLNSNVQDLDPIVYLSPFLDIIRSETTSGIVTAHGLTALYKFILYGLIDINSHNAASVVENIADSVTHARFKSVDASSDEIVLMKIVQVLQLLLISPIGSLLTNDSVCEIIPSFFRICFEVRFSEILRKTAENALVDSVHFLFSCLPHFSDDNKYTATKKLQIHSDDLRASLSDQKKQSVATKQTSNNTTTSQNKTDGCIEENNSNYLQDNVTPPVEICIEMDSSQSDCESTGEQRKPDVCDSDVDIPENDFMIVSENPDSLDKCQDGKSLVNSQGVQFTRQQTTIQGCGSSVPYGLPCLKELFGLLISLINPNDRCNSEKTIQIGLSLITVALETGSGNLGNFKSLLSLIKDELCHNLLSLFSTERLSVFSSILHIFFLLFEGLRVHLKFQLEMFLTKLIEVIMSESPNVSFTQREMSLDCLKRLWQIPGFLTELFINYDCDLYSSNLFEHLTKLLSENAFAMTDLYSIQLLSLDTLITVINSIENRCHSRILSKNEISPEVTSAINVALSASQQECLVSQQVNADEVIKSGDDHSLFSSEATIKIFSHEDVMTIKHKKKILNSGTEQFNSHPSKGISFLQEHELLKKPVDPQEVATFLRNNPRLDKKMIGEYVSNRKNLDVLGAFVKSFSFKDIRIDDALRQYLESFRLPGEAPLISLILEHFAEHWHTSNSHPFENNDAAFTLAYAIVMLNVDQHNRNVKKQKTPMTAPDFKKNLRSVNGNKDFEEDLLEKIYTAIRNEEIVMPAEQTGVVKENYLWKVLLRRGKSEEGKFLHTEDGAFDHDLFSMIWGPTVSALSFILDKSTDVKIIENTISSFQKCATIAAHYGMADVFDNIIISLCKFTLLDSASDLPKLLPVMLGSNIKAQIAVKAVFKLVHSHGDILREGWRNFLDCILCLFKARLLPVEMVEAEDFLSPKGVVSLIRDDVTISVTPTESGLFGSLYSYITSDPSSQRGSSQEDELAKTSAKECIEECHCEQLFIETKFLRLDSLHELVKSLIFLCPRPEPESPLSSQSDEDSAVFILELLIKVVLYNRDRISSVWPDIQNHMFSIIMSAAITNHSYILERAVIGILRISLRLIRKEDMLPQVMQVLRVLLYLKPSALLATSRQMAYALNELLKTNGANISDMRHWSIVFSLLERIGAGGKPPQVITTVVDEPIPVNCDYSPHMTSAQSDSELSTGGISHDSGFNSERGYTSDGELYENTKSNLLRKNSLPRLFTSLHPNIVDPKNVLLSAAYSASNSSQYDISFLENLFSHDSLAFLKCCESLTLLVKDDTLITTENFESCVHCLRAFIEASSNGGVFSKKRVAHGRPNKEKKAPRRGGSLRWKGEKSKKEIHSIHPEDVEHSSHNEDNQTKFAQAYQGASLELLHLLHILHTRASRIFSEDNIATNQPQDSVGGHLWNKCWCPLLQGTARLCYDSRAEVRMSAFSLLQHALLVPELRVLHPAEWEDCFNKVLFPLLGKLLEDIDPHDQIGTEEARTRGASLLCKVFLQHLNPLLTLPTFIHLWSTILDFMNDYNKADVTGSLSEAIPESLKNMILVMNTAGVFMKPENAHPGNEIWQATWHRIDSPLSFLKDELFPPPRPPPTVVAVEPDPNVAVDKQ